MAKKNPMAGRIPAAQLSSFKTWDFPKVGGQHVVRSAFKEESEPRPEALQHQLISDGPLTVGEIERLREQARAEGHAEGLEQGLAQGHQQGLEAGKSEGYQAAYQQAEAEINDLKSRLLSLQQGLYQPLRDQSDAIEQAVLGLVVDTATAVTRRELATRSELLEQAVHEALEALPQQAQQLCFFVHPDDEALLQQLQQQERADWEIAADASLARGGVRVRGEASFLDFSVEERLRQVVTQLLEPTAEADDGDHGSTG